LTDARPKCLTEVLGRPLLDWQLDALRAGGVGPVMVVRGYRAELLAGPGYATLDHPRWSSTSSVGTLRAADAWLRAESCVVSYSDIAVRGDHVRRLVQCDADVAITSDLEWLALWSERFDDPLQDAETLRVDGDWLVEIGGRTDDPSCVDGQFMGLLKVTPRGWGELSAVCDALPPAELDRLDTTSLLSRFVASGGRVRVVPVRGGWCEIDRPEDRHLVEERCRAGGWRHDWRDTAPALLP
jgi:choline kinase